MDDLYDLIEFPSEFSFSNYREGEQDLLVPLLEAKRYSNIKFGDGERDSFGPLSRTVQMRDEQGELVTAWYG